MLVRIKSLAKSMARTCGLDIVQHVETLLNPFDVLSYVVDAHAAEGPLYFVQIGAHDGVRNDPIRDSVIQHNMAGIFVEPMGDFFDKLKANYKSQENVTFERCAISEQLGTATIYRIASDAPLPAWCHGLASFDRSHISGKKYGMPGLENHIVEEQVPSMTLPQLLEKHGQADVDLLQIDTEGFDYEVVRQALDSNLRPKIINYEYTHLPPGVRLKCKKRLAQCGYEFVDVGRDTLAVKKQ